jgi:hypothetical protein
LLFGKEEIKKIIKNYDDQQFSKILERINNDNESFMFFAPSRTSADLTLLTKVIKNKNKITFSFKYKINDNAPAVLDQKFYLGVFSKNCVLIFNTLPTIREEFKNEKAS